VRAGEPNRGTVTQRVLAPLHSDDRVPQWRALDCGGGYWPKVVSFLVLRSLLPNAQRPGNKLSLSVCCGAGLQYCQVSDSQPSNNIDSQPSNIEVIGEELGSQPSNIIVVIQEEFHIIVVTQKSKHNHMRRTCKECGGSGICEHNRIGRNCKDCRQKTD
jgi:hypothetical protein